MSTQVLDRIATGDIAQDGLRGDLATRRRIRVSRRLIAVLLGLIAAGGDRLVRLGLVAGRPFYPNHRRRLCRRQRDDLVAACRRLRRQDPGRRQSVRPRRPTGGRARRPRLQGQSRACRRRGSEPDGGTCQSACEIHAAAIDDPAGGGRPYGEESGSGLRPRGRCPLPCSRGLHLRFVADRPESLCRRPEGGRRRFDPARPASRPPASNSPCSTPRSPKPKRASPRRRPI